MVGVQQPLSRSPGGLDVASYSVQLLPDVIRSRSLDAVASRPCRLLVSTSIRLAASVLSNESFKVDILNSHHSLTAEFTASSSSTRITEPLLELSG